MKFDEKNTVPFIFSNFFLSTFGHLSQQLIFMDRIMVCSTTNFFARFQNQKKRGINYDKIKKLRELIKNNSTNLPDQQSDFPLRKIDEKKNQQKILSPLYRAVKSTIEENKWP